jgi:ferredoxin, 2Fe-2S
VDGQVTQTVSVEPAGIVIELEPGENLLRAAQRRGYRWPTVCDGNASCGVCVAQVVSGFENCSEIGTLERERIIALNKPVDGKARLACQLQINGPITVHRRGVRRKVANSVDQKEE